MKIVVLDHARFVAPARAEDVVNAPLSSCMFAGYVAAAGQSSGFEVQLLDANLLGWSCEQTVGELAAMGPDLVAVNLIYMWDETGSILEMLRDVKRRVPGCHVTLFGYYPTFAFDFLLRECGVTDSVIIGEPEATALELAGSLARGQDWRTAPGLAFRAPAGVVRTAGRPVVDDLDALPFPMRSELAVRAARGVSPYVLGSRGCYNQCSFCYLNSFYGVGPRWRGRSPENILSELRELGSRERFEYFYFADANFFGPGRSGQERAARLAEVLRSEFPGVGFGLECRANDIQRETMGALRAAGLRHVFIGVESGCDKTLRRMRKGVRAGTNARAVGMLRDLGIRVSLGFIMFDPDSTLEEVRESFEFLKDNGLLDTPCVTGHLLHHRARVLKGTPLFQSVCSRPGSDAGSFSGYECTYRIRDERADLLARSVEPILRYALSLVGTEQECGKGKDARLARVNQVMIDFFESALSLLEQAKSTPPEREMEELAHAMERNMKEAVS